MTYLLTSDRRLLEAYQADVDVKLGYPEALEMFQDIGLGPWVSKELCRAQHYAEVLVDQTGTRFALPVSDAVPVPEGVTVGDLPEDWYPALEVV